MAELELGQMLTSNNNWHQHDADWATEGLHMIAQVIAEFRGADPNGFRTTLTTNSGEEEFANDVFEMRSYCWCGAGDVFGYEEEEEEESKHPHAKGCPPNFFYKPTGLTITWYKYAGRGTTANQEYLGAKQWFEIIKTCIESINKDV